jgi:hypothetical protein
LGRHRRPETTSADHNKREQGQFANEANEVRTKAQAGIAQLQAFVPATTLNASDCVRSVMAELNQAEVSRRLLIVVIDGGRASDNPSQFPEVTASISASIVMACHGAEPTICEASTAPWRTALGASGVHPVSPYDLDGVDLAGTLSPGMPAFQ